MNTEAAAWVAVALAVAVIFFAPMIVREVRYAAWKRREHKKYRKLSREAEARRKNIERTGL